MRVIIIEDEFLTAQRLDSMLNRYDAAIEVEAILPSVAMAVDWLKTHTSPDLIFMDIHLEDGSCFDIFETINLDVPVIFTTAYDEYMVKAFKVNSVDYLMKPINSDELFSAIDKFKRVHGAAAEELPDDDRMELLLRSLRREQADYKERFLISAGSRLITIETSHIRYFFSNGKVTFLVTDDNQRYPIDYSLDKLTQLLKPGEFFRVNRHTLLRHKAIRQIQVMHKGRLLLELEPSLKEEVLVSIDRVTAFKDWLGK